MSYSSTSGSPSSRSPASRKKYNHDSRGYLSTGGKGETEKKFWTLSEVTTYHGKINQLELENAELKEKMAAMQAEIDKLRAAQESTIAERDEAKKEAAAARRDEAEAYDRGCKETRARLMATYGEAQDKNAINKREVGLRLKLVSLILEGAEEEADEGSPAGAKRQEVTPLILF